jgi:hypothetical protein
MFFVDRLALRDPGVGDFGPMASSDLIDDVYGCELCPGELFGFTRRPNGNGFYKFPPTIGARGEAALLFIGINPRMTTNMRLHKELAEHRASFAILAGNHVPYNGKAGGPRYISPRGEEKHYRPHARIVTGAFGEQAAFEDHAAVTELFLCASADSKLLPPDRPCADRYLGRVVAHVKPQLIIGVGAMPRDYLFAHSVAREDGRWQVEIDGHRAWAIHLPHPRFGVPDEDIVRVAAQARRVASGGLPRPDRQPQVRARVAPPVAASGPGTSLPPPRELTERGDTASVAVRPSASTIGAWWMKVLDQNVSATRQMRELAPLLALHPDAADLTAELLRDLTVWKLIRIANVEFNKLRPQHIPPLQDPVARSRAAWELLIHHLATMPMKTTGTDWARTEELLRPGSQPALAYIQRLPITHVITACENLIRYPYRSV